MVSHVLYGFSQVSTLLTWWKGQCLSLFQSNYASLSPIIAGSPNPEMGRESLGICLPTALAPCRELGVCCVAPLIAPPETGFLRQAPGPANCLPPPVPPGPTTSGARLRALQALSLGPELWSFSGPEIQPHLGAGLLFQTRKYKAFIHLLLLN